MVNLAGLAYRPRTTNLTQGFCSAVDFVVLLLGTSGPMRLSAIYAALSSFRGVPLNANGQVGRCNHLFNRIYGYVSFASNPNVPWPVFFCRAGTTSTSLWYRVSPGVYALNANGLARFRRLVA